MSMPATAPTNGRRRRQDPRVESVAGGYPGWLRGYLRGLKTLPTPGDDLQRDFGSDIYKRMLLDSTVSAGVRTLTLSTLSQGCHLTPVALPEDAPKARKGLAAEIAAFCSYNLEGINPHAQDVYCDLLEAMAHGYRAAELVYRDAGEGETEAFPTLRSGALLLKAIKPKPNDALNFVVDEFFNVHGFVARGAYGVQPFTADVKTILPREKFAVLSWEPRDCDPRGRSILRFVYTPWYYKMQAWGELLKYLMQFAGPSLIALMDEAVASEPDFDADEDTDAASNDPLLDRTVNTLIAIQNGTAGALRGVKELIPLVMQGEGGAFYAAMGFFDSQIEKGLTLQTLAGSEAKHGTRAQAGVHQDTLGLTVAYAKTTLAETLRDDVLTPLVVNNYGPKARGLVPTVSFSQSGVEDLPNLLKAYAAAGWKPHRNHYPEIDGKVGLEPRSADWAPEDDEEPETLPPDETEDAEEDPGAEEEEGGEE